MEFNEVLRTRRSINAFLSTPVPQEKLEALIDSARFSPSGNNNNTWRFLLITQHDLLKRLSQTHGACKWLNAAPAGIAIVIEPASTRYWLKDCSVAAYSIWLAATVQGLGAAWAAMYQSDNPDEPTRRQQFIREMLSIPDNLTIPMVLAIGYPESQPSPKNRPEVKDVICWERYSDGDPRQI